MTRITASTRGGATVTALVNHAPGCTATPSRSGEVPHILVIRNVKTGVTATTCTTCGAVAEADPDRPAALLPAHHGVSVTGKGAP